MSARLRLGLCGVLFAIWIGWLGYLAATTTRPVVLSQPQLMASTLFVVAQVSADGSNPAAPVHVTAVHWPPGRAELVNTELTVTNLPASLEANGWAGPGEYI